jgi:hypothetical protein
MGNVQHRRIYHLEQLPADETNNIKSAEANHTQDANEENHKKLVSSVAIIPLRGGSCRTLRKGGTSLHFTLLKKFMVNFNDSFPNYTVITVLTLYFEDVL